MLRHLRYRLGTPCLILAAMLALTGNSWSQAPAESSQRHKTATTGPIDFAAMDLKGDVSVDAPIPTELRLDLKTTFRLGLISNSINPLAEDLILQLQYAGAIGPIMYDVFVPADCFTQKGKSYVVGMQDIHTCGLSIQLVSGAIGPLDLRSAVESLDLRLVGTVGPIDMPRPNAKWDLKLNIAFLASTPNGPIAGIIAILGGPTKVKLAIGKGDTGDRGEVTIDRVAFEGRVVK